MKGQILDFSLQNSSGLITGEDGKRYTFNSAEWKEQGLPTKGMTVDFDLTESGEAVGVYKALSTKSNSVSVALNNAAQTRNENGELSLFALFLDTITKRYAQFTGRATRREYWGFYLFNMIISVALQILAEIGVQISDTIGGLMLVILSIVSLGLALPHIAVSIRRLHDINKSGWWFLLALVPIVGWIWLIVLLCQPSTPESNQYGDIPQ